jgi:hypothetical protein
MQDLEAETHDSRKYTCIVHWQKIDLKLGFDAKLAADFESNRASFSEV